MISSMSSPPPSYPAQPGSPLRVERAPTTRLYEVTLPRLGLTRVKLIPPRDLLSGRPTDGVPRVDILYCQQSGLPCRPFSPPHPPPPWPGPAQDGVRIRLPCWRGVSFFGRVRLFARVDTEVETEALTQRADERFSLNTSRRGRGKDGPHSDYRIPHEPAR